MSAMQQLRAKGQFTGALDAMTGDIAVQSGSRWEWLVGQIMGEKALDVRSVGHGDCEPSKVTGVVPEHRRTNESRIHGVAELSEAADHIMVRRVCAPFRRCHLVHPNRRLKLQHKPELSVCKQVRRACRGVPVEIPQGRFVSAGESRERLRGARLAQRRGMPKAHRCANRGRRGRLRSARVA